MNFNKTILELELEPLHLQEYYYYYSFFYV